MPTIPSVRRLLESDAEAYQTLLHEALTTDQEAFGSSVEDELHTGIDVYRRRMQSSLVMGAQLQDTLVGMATMAREPLRKKHHRAVISGVYVRPAERGHGIGTMIIREIIEEAVRARIAQLELKVVSVNDAAIKLYTHFGFRTVGKEPRALKIGDRYLDEDVMVKFLS